MLLYGIEAYLLTGASQYYQLLDYVGDETDFYQLASHYTLAQGFVDAYGLIFWSISKGLITSSPFDFSTTIIILRLIFLSFKYIAFALGAFTVLHIRGRTAAVAFYITLLATPGYYFYGKVFSPEYLLLCLTALAIYCYVKNYLYALIVVAMTAVCLKIYAAPLMLLPLTLFIAQPKKWAYVIVTSLIGLFFNLLPILNPAGFHATYAAFHAVSGHADIHYIKQWYTINGKTWDQIPLRGISRDFNLVIFLGVAFIIPYLLHRNFKKIDIKGSMVLIAGLCMGLLVCTSASILTWYLFPVYFTILIGLFLVSYDLKYSQFIVVLLAILTIANVEKIVWRMHDRAWHNHLLQQNEATTQCIQQYLKIHYPQGGVILTDILVSYTPLVSSHYTLLPIRRVIAYPQSYPPPTFIIINQQIQQSPLLDINYHGYLTGYVPVKSFNGLLLYVKKENYQTIETTPPLLDIWTTFWPTMPN